LPPPPPPDPPPSPEPPAVGSDDNDGTDRDDTDRRSDNDNDDDEDDEDDGGDGDSTNSADQESGEGYSELGVLSAAVSAVVTSIASTGWVRKRIRPLEFEEQRKREKRKRQHKEILASDAESSREAAAKALSGAMKGASQSLAVGSLKAGKGSGSSGGTLSWLAAQARTELKEALTRGVEMDLPQKSTQEAREMLERMYAFAQKGHKTANKSQAH